MAELNEPIKVRWQGDSRVKYETRTLEPLSADGAEYVDDARRANAKQKTQIVIETEEELEGTIRYLDKHIEFCGQYGAIWGTRGKQKAAERVLDEILNQKE